MAILGDTRHRKENCRPFGNRLAFQSAEVQGGALGYLLATAPSGPSEGLGVDVICKLVAADLSSLRCDRSARTERFIRHEV
jgi:hypothetical protein